MEKNSKVYSFGEINTRPFFPSLFKWLEKMQILNTEKYLKRDCYLSNYFLYFVLFHAKLPTVNILPSVGNVDS